MTPSSFARPEWRRSALTVLCAAAIPELASAQSVSIDQVRAQSVRLEEVRVTAQKRDQSAQEVPITLTAYSGDFLNTLNIEEFDRLSDFVPGLVVQEQSVNNPGFVIRGITSDSGSARIAPRVSIYQDGVDISRSRGSIIELFDLERVEVLKGPQSTLFGSGAAIGAIEVVSARPTETFEGSVSGGLGNYSERRTRGHISGPLGDTAGGRLAFTYKKRDGFIKNIDGRPESQNPGKPAEALNGTETLALRGFLEWQPTDSLQVDLILNYQRDTPPGTAFKSGSIPPTGGTTDPNSFAELGPHGSVRNEFLGGDLGIDRKVQSTTLNISYDLSEAWTVNSISNARSFDSLEVFDADGTAAFWLEFAEDAESDQWSQEIRANFNDGGAVSGFFGASYFWEDGTQAVPFATDEGVFAACLGLVPGLPCINPDGSVNSIFPVPVIFNERFGNTGKNTTWSVYADATWQITPQFTATAGIRYLEDERQGGAFADGNTSALFGGPFLGGLFGNTGGRVVRSDTETFDAWLPRLSLSYFFSDDLHVYVNVGEGRVAPVIDVDGQGGATNPFAIVSILPAEEIWNYEIGMKSQWLDNRLGFDLSYFYQEYENFQTSIIDPVSGVATPVNAGSATNSGVEMALNASLSEQFTLYGTVGFIDATFDDTDSAGNPQIFGGNRFRLQPETTASLALVHAVGLSDGASLQSMISLTYRSEVFFENENTPIAGQDIAEDAISLVGVNIGYTTAGGDWRLSAYADNLLDEEYIIDAGNTGGVFGTPTFIAAPPRFYGVEVTYKF